MPSNRVIVMAPKHFHTVFASSQDVQLHLVVKETVMLLPMALVLA